MWSHRCHSSHGNMLLASNEMTNTAYRETQLKGKFTSLRLGEKCSFTLDALNLLCAYAPKQQKALDLYAVVQSCLIKAAGTIQHLHN